MTGEPISTGTALLLSSAIGGATALASTAMAPKPPKVTPPTPMPTTDDAAVRKKRAADRAALMSRSGRTSTQLTPTKTTASYGANNALTAPGTSTTL